MSLGVFQSFPFTEEAKGEEEADMTGAVLLQLFFQFLVDFLNRRQDTRLWN